MGKEHNFYKTLEELKNDNWDEFRFNYYRRWFGNNVVDIRKSTLQEDCSGIDFVLHMRSGETIFIDEKLTNYDDENFCFEEFSSFEHQTCGWIEKENYKTRYVAYWKKKHYCYMFDFLTLQKTWLENKEEWKKTCKKIHADNITYTTISWLIPKEKIFKAMNKTIFTIFSSTN
jgi:hypothetical protein